MGQRLLSVKGQGPWRGVSKLSVNDRGQRRFLQLKNCYVNRDGSELRQFPGYGTFIDPSDINNTAGYGRYTVDTVRPVVDYGTPNAPFRFGQPYIFNQSQTIWSRAKPSCYFAFEQIGNEVVILGETRFREDPFYNQFRQVINPDLIDEDGSGRLVIRMTGITGPTLTDQGASGNGVQVGQIVYCEGFTALDNAALQTLLDDRVNGKLHEIVAVDTVNGNFTVSTTLSKPAGNASLSAGFCHRVRPNRDDFYPTDGSLGPYDATVTRRPDDPDALTAWRVLDIPTFADIGSTPPVYPAWVANRIRDHGDENSLDLTEGIVLHNNGSINVRGASRREQLRLPFRPNIDTALDRIILACPQYGCMFHVPLKVPIDPANWEQGAASLRGVRAPNNSIFDRPRSLGLPKPRLIADVPSLALSPQPSPGVFGAYQIAVSRRDGDAARSFPNGAYRVAVAFLDPGTGEEGLASDPIEVEVPLAASNGVTISLTYVHPGYVMPEAMALRMNVYIAPPGSEALGYYGTFDLTADYHNMAALGDPLTPNVSGYYGAGPAVTPADPLALYQRFDLPVRFDPDVSPNIDFFRQAPFSATMPRGAEACRYIRGVLFAGGALGNAGLQGQLWRNTTTARFQLGSQLYRADELLITVHAQQDAAIPSISGATDGNTVETTLGIAGRAFPDAYQGIQVLVRNAFPTGNAIRTIDRVLNRRVRDLDGLFSPTGNERTWHEEVLQLSVPAWEEFGRAGQATPTASEVSARKETFYVMPRGQLQIGDPGAPWRSSRAFIKIIDPNDGDDISAIGQLGGSAIVCTRKETYSYSWYRNPGSETPNLMSRQFGCIAGNSMVEFDGGLAWISDRGPVALGEGLQHVGADIADDFNGENARYLRDSQGMMRHCWSHHDAQRGLVMWGLLAGPETGAADTTLDYDGVSYVSRTIGRFQNGLPRVPDGVASRFACNEILIWSYRANAFSTWNPPAGLGVYWMRSLRDKTGNIRTCFLAEDGRIYALDDEWSDRNGVRNLRIVVTALAAGKASTTFSFNDVAATQDGPSQQRNFRLLLAPGMLVEFLNANGDVVFDTVISSVDAASDAGTTSTITLAAPYTWTLGQKVRIGGRQRTSIITHFIGAETADTLQVQRVQMRYTLKGKGAANARVKLFKQELGVGSGEQAVEVAVTEPGKWEALGWPRDSASGVGGTTGPEELGPLTRVTPIGRRHNFSKVGASAPEMALQVELTGEAQVRIQDLSFEIG